MGVKTLVITRKWILSKYISKQEQPNECFAGSKCIVMKVLLFIIKIYSVVAMFRIFWMKIIEHTCKFMATKWLMVYHTINNHRIWSNKPSILWIPNPNRKCFDIIISPLLTPCNKSAAYDSSTLVIFSLLETLCFLWF